MTKKIKIISFVIIPLFLLTIFITLYFLYKDDILNKSDYKIDKISDMWIWVVTNDWNWILSNDNNIDIEPIATESIKESLKNVKRN